MKKLSKMFLVLITFVVMSACAAIDNVQEQSTQRLSELIIEYCKQTNEQFRADFREKINRGLDGQATIKVDCTLNEANNGETSLSKRLALNRPVEGFNPLQTKIDKSAVVQNQNFDRMYRF